MNLKQHPELRDKLAAEYALGTLKGGARRRFERWLSDDAALRAEVAAWRERLVPMAEFAPPATPPARVWSAIQARIGGAPARSVRPVWLLRIWQGLALGSTAVAGVLAVVLAQRAQAPTYDQLATLTDEQARTALVVAADRKHGSMDVRVVAGVHVPDDRTLQLWAITHTGQPRSLGIVPDNRYVRLALDARAIGPDVALLAISLEPKGGSPNPNAPTGPVLWKGNWVSM
jgi:anti-sigma-K factor RskA